MGRDTSIVFTHDLLETATGRAIVDAEDAAGLYGDTVRFDIKPTKLHIFDSVTGEVIKSDRSVGKAPEVSQ